MIKYLIDVIKDMRMYPFKKGYNFRIWIRNRFYLRWQKPAKWNFDFYLLYKAATRRWRVAK